jgi:hypothetical protein
MNTKSCTVAPKMTHSLGMRRLLISSMDKATAHMRLGNNKM